MATYYAMIGNVGYLSCEADNDDEARSWFAIHLHHRGEGIFRRWLEFGMRVSIFKRQTPDKEFTIKKHEGEKPNGNHEGFYTSNFISDRRAYQGAHH